MTVAFGVLGPVRCTRDGEPVPLGGPQQRRILAALLADSGRLVPVVRLIEAMWPEEPPDGAARTARTYISRLRAAVGDELVVTEGPGYRLAVAPEAIDAVRF